MLPLLAVLLAADPYTIESNVIYGMYSGAALLMDVWQPTQPKGLGIIHVSGSGWTQPLAYGAGQLKTVDQSVLYARALASAGFTVFVVNHRSLPRFRYPAPVDDVQRAVRFIRHNAKRWNIRPDKIGASGGSSGGHLVSLLGVLDGQGIANDPDPVERESAKVQCVVARAAPTNFFTSTNGNFITGMAKPAPDADKQSEEYRIYFNASPISWVDSGDPPFLLMHGDKDEQVPFQQSVDFEARLKSAGVTVRLLRIANGAHGATFPGASNPPDYLGEMTRWFTQHLR